MAEPIGGEEAPRQRAPLPESLDARQRARRDRIVQATVQMLPHTEYEQLQMKEVTAAAGVALGTTYRYFNSKEHLVAEALLVWAMQFAREPVAHEGKTVDRLKFAYHRAVRAFELSPCVYGHMVAVQGSHDPRAVDIFDLFASGQLDAFATYLARVPNPRQRPGHRGDECGLRREHASLELRPEVDRGRLRGDRQCRRPPRRLALLRFHVGSCAPGDPGRRGAERGRVATGTLGDHLGDDRDRALGRRVRAEVEARGTVQAREVGVAHARVAQRPITRAACIGREPSAPT